MDHKCGVLEVPTSFKVQCDRCGGELVVALHDSYAGGIHPDGSRHLTRMILVKPCIRCMEAAKSLGTGVE